MKLLVVPPHRDPTLRPRADPPFELHDLQAAFLARLTSPASLTAQIDRRRALSPSPAVAHELLLLLAARSILSRDAGPLHSTLRSFGAVLTACSGAPSSVQLRLDDLELSSGTTERSSDVLTAANQVPLPWQAELDSLRSTL